MFSISHRRRRLMEGLLLGLGAPAGWAGLCTVLGLWPKADFEYSIWLFLYMILGTSAAFGTFSYLLGSNEERFAEQSIRDPLTELHNRRFFQDRFEQELAQFLRSGTPVTIVLIDLDHFKAVNDTYGHQAGDVVLKEAAKRMRGVVRREDVLARVGGEEFAVLMPGGNTENGRVLAERIRNAIQDTPVILPTRSALPVKATLGVAGADRTPVENSAQLYSAADAALYAGKEAGRNRVVVHGSAPGSPSA